jgi:hypothetical protein
LVQGCQPWPVHGHHAAGPAGAAVCQAGRVPPAARSVHGQQLAVIELRDTSALATPRRFNCMCMVDPTGMITGCCSGRTAYQEATAAFSMWNMSVRSVIRWTVLHHPGVAVNCSSAYCGIGSVMISG